MKPLRSEIRGLEDAQLILRGGMPNQYIGIRLPSELLDRIERCIDKINRANPGLLVNRTDAIRMLLAQALDAFEGKPPKKSGGK